MIVKELMLMILSILLFSCAESKIETGPSDKILALLEQSKALKQRGDRVEQSMLRKKDSIDLLIDGPSSDQDNTVNGDFVDITSLSNDFVLDMRYATSNNFLKEKVYPCAKCYVRKNVANALLQANKDLMKEGYRIKLFDCYRPHSIQKKMWKIFPNPGYVADPKGGSVHNRGAAVDLSIVRLDGGAIDMGTDFDHFGKEAHHSYSMLSKTVLGHRKLLKEIMQKNGFTTIRTEWWHYNYKSGKSYKISDFTWECN